MMEDKKAPVESPPGGASLTRQFFLGVKPVQEKTSLNIAGCYQIFGKVQIAICLPGEENNKFWFGVRKYVKTDNGAYILVTYPPEMFAEEDVEPVVAFRMDDKSTAVALTEDEFKSIALPCISSLNDEKPVDLKAMEEKLGHIPDWETERDKIDSLM